MLCKIKPHLYTIKFKASFSAHVFVLLWFWHRVTAENVLKYPRWTHSPLNTYSWFRDNSYLHLQLFFPLFQRLTSDDTLYIPQLSWVEASSVFCIPKGGTTPWAEPTGVVITRLLSAPSPWWVWGEPQRWRAHQATFHCCSTSLSQRKSCRANSI